jgi:hypothetical protein
MTSAAASSLSPLGESSSGIYSSASLLNHYYAGVFIGAADTFFI